MRGDTLIEVLIALAVVVVIISGITVLGTTSLRNAQFVNAQDQASKYAQEGMEIVRQIRNSAYIQYGTYDGIYCLGEDETTFGTSVSSCTIPNIYDKYIRYVQIAQPNNPINQCGGTNLSYTTVIVSWTDGKCTTGTFCHSSKLSSCFSTQPLIPTP